jgi:hypothetical protein
MMIPTTAAVCVAVVGAAVCVAVVGAAVVGAAVCVAVVGAAVCVAVVGAAVGVGETPEWPCLDRIEGGDMAQKLAQGQLQQLQRAFHACWAVAAVAVVFAAAAAVVVFGAADAATVCVAPTFALANRKHQLTQLQLARVNRRPCQRKQP